MKLKLLLISSLLLISCATTSPPEIVTQVVEVKIPVFKSPEFTIPEKPYIPLEDLTLEDGKDHNKVGKAYVLSIEIYEAYTFKLRNLLEGIKKAED